MRGWKYIEVCCFLMAAFAMTDSRTVLKYKSNEGPKTKSSEGLRKTRNIYYPSMDAMLAPGMQPQSAPSEYGEEISVPENSEYKVQIPETSEIEDNLPFLENTEIFVVETNDDEFGEYDLLFTAENRVPNMTMKGLDAMKLPNHNRQMRKDGKEEILDSEILQYRDVEPRLPKEDENDLVITNVAEVVHSSEKSDLSENEEMSGDGSGQDEDNLRYVNPYNANQNRIENKIRKKGSNVKDQRQKQSRQRSYAGEQGMSKDVKDSDETRKQKGEKNGNSQIPENEMEQIQDLKIPAQQGQMANANTEKTDPKKSEVKEAEENASFLAVTGLPDNYNFLAPSDVYYYIQPQPRKYSEAVTANDPHVTYVLVSFPNEEMLESSNIGNVESEERVLESEENLNSENQELIGVEPSRQRRDQSQTKQNSKVKENYFPQNDSGSNLDERQFNVDDARDPRVRYEDSDEFGNFDVDDGEYEEYDGDELHGEDDPQGPQYPQLPPHLKGKYNESINVRLQPGIDADFPGKNSLQEPQLDFCATRIRSGAIGSPFTGSKVYKGSWQMPGNRLPAGHGQYLFKSFTWLQSRNACRKYCMETVSLESELENFIIENIMKGENLTYVWTSGRRCDRTSRKCHYDPTVRPFIKNGWYWSGENTRLPVVDDPTQPWGTTGFLDARQPDNAEFKIEEVVEESCLVLLRDYYEPGMKWHDSACHIRHVFLCEDSEYLLRKTEAKHGVRLTRG